MINLERGNIKTKYMKKEMELYVLSKTSSDCYTTTIMWETIDELIREIEIVEKISDELFGKQCYWEWDEDECTDFENKIIGGEL
jgi:hypothetical protein